MKTYRHISFFLFLACIVGLTISVASCKKDKDSYSGKYFSGTLSFGADDYYIAGQNVTFSANINIVSPTTMDSVTLTWNSSAFVPNTEIGESYTVTLPDILGSYDVSLVASADDYTSRTSSFTVTIIPDNFFDAITNLKSPTDTIDDIRDNERYPFRTIGNLDWFVHNLNWKGAGRTYKDQAAYGIIFGRLYSWHEMMTGDSASVSGGVSASGLAGGPQGVCPAGWHVPTDQDWEDLGKALNGGTAVSGSSWENLGKKAAADGKLLGNIMWDYDINNTKENTAGWNAIPSGAIFGNMLSKKFSYAYWWSATEHTESQARYRYISATNATFYGNNTDKTEVYFSVRCVRPATTTP